MATNNVVEFLRNYTTEADLVSRLQTEAPVTGPDIFSPLCRINYNCHLPHLSWDDVLNLVRTVYHNPSGQDHHILFIRSAREELPAHTHSYFEIIYVLSGTCVHSFNGNTETLQAGDLCILPPPAQHMQFKNFSSLSAKILVLPSYFISICPGLLQKNDALGTFLANCIYSQSNEQYLLIHTGHDSFVRAKILEIGQEALRDDHYSDLIISGLFMSLLVWLGKNYEISLKSIPPQNIVHEILAVLQNEYATITLESLAKHLHYSVPYCSKYIKKLFGCNFSYLLRWARLQIAADYLKKSTLTVNQISKVVGYENPENFMRAFKNQYHLTPTQYREQNVPSIHSWQIGDIS